MMRRKRWLLVKGAAGLGNRMLAVLTAMLYADITGRRLVVDWSDDAYSDDGTNAFPVYFDCPWVSGIDALPAGGSVEPPLWKNRLDLSVGELRAEVGLPKREFNRRSRIDVRRRNYRQKTAVFWSPKDRVQQLRVNLPAGLADVSTEDLLGSVLRDRMLLQPAIRDRVERFRSEYLPSPTLGVHVRYSDKQGDVDALLQELGQARQADPNLGAFLATDNVEVRARFEREHPDIVTAPHWYPKPGERAHGNPNAPSRLEQGVEALVDMYLLAGCDRLAIDSSSSFARVAALLRTTTATTFNDRSIRDDKKP
jgi:hypothetical protein